jgi:cyclopropane fatty-acyl-phospholipid synthase-like methyltransferase
VTPERSYVEKYTFSGITRLGQYRKRSLQAHLFDAFLPKLQQGETILEIGCGRGEFAAECRRRGYEYTGIEPSASLAQSLAERGYHVIKQEVPKINVSDNKFDLIHSMDLVEHLLTYEQVLAFLLDCQRALKPNGHISIIAPNYSTLKESFFEYDYQHSFPTTEYRIVSLVQDCGFRVVRRAKFLFAFGLKGSYKTYFDRALAHTLIPISRNPIVRSMTHVVGGETLGFKIHKNLCDHVGILAVK